MSKKNQHVVPDGNNWAVKGAGNDKATKDTGRVGHESFDPSIPQGKLSSGHKYHLKIM